MASTDEFRMASFWSVMVAPRLLAYVERVGDASPQGAQARVQLLENVLWLQLGSRLGYWDERVAAPVLQEMTVVFDGIYEWLQVHGRVLPGWQVDEILRIKDAGLDAPGALEPQGEEAREAAALHLRNGLMFMGRYIARGQGAASLFAADLMFASDEEGQAALARVESEGPSGRAQADEWIEEAASVLRYMEGALTIANAAARETRFDELQGQRLSNELLGLATWSLNLGEPSRRQRFDEAFTRVIDAMRRDLDVSWLEDRIRAEIASLANVWEAAALELAPPVRA